MPVDTDIQRRNRALIAFAILTAMRDSALASLRLKHVDAHTTPPLVRQEPDMVKTKFSKQILAYFLTYRILRWAGSGSCGKKSCMA